MTNDVEDLALSGFSNSEIAHTVVNESIPHLLDLYAQYGVHSTMFFVAEFAARYPNIVKRVQSAGHEVACHGLTHDYTYAYDVTNLETQIEHLTRSKKILEDICGQEVVSFRAPALRVNSYTPQALRETGFLFDSSVAPQRMDMFMSLGSKNKKQWICAPREVYQTSDTNLARRGNSGIFEMPVSACGLPYLGTLMRVSPLLNSLSRYMVWLETKNNPKKAINFLFHPSEAAIQNVKEMVTSKRAKSWLGHFFSDVLRSKLKQRNLGPIALQLFEKELFFWNTKKYKYVSLQEYAKQQSL